MAKFPVAELIRILTECSATNQASNQKVAHNNEGYYCWPSPDATAQICTTLNSLQLQPINDDTPRGIDILLWDGELFQIGHWRPNLELDLPGYWLNTRGYLRINPTHWSSVLNFIELPKS